MLKSFAIEKRLKAPMQLCYFNDWHIMRKYATEKQRDEALKALANREMWEYRKKDLK